MIDDLLRWRVRRLFGKIWEKWFFGKKSRFTSRLCLRTPGGFADTYLIGKRRHFCVQRALAGLSSCSGARVVNFFPPASRAPETVWRISARRSGATSGFHRRQTSCETLEIDNLCTHLPTLIQVRGRCTGSWKMRRNLLQVRRMSKRCVGFFLPRHEWQDEDMFWWKKTNFRHIFIYCRFITFFSEFWFSETCRRAR